MAVDLQPYKSRVIAHVDYVAAMHTFFGCLMFAALEPVSAWRAWRGSSTVLQCMLSTRKTQFLIQQHHVAAPDMVW
jgi:hypothetical protein